MQTYKVGDRTLAIVNGELYERLAVAGEVQAEVEQPQEPVAAPKRTKVKTKVRKTGKDYDRAEMRRLRDSGMTINDIAKQMGIGYGTAYAILRETPATHSGKHEVRLKDIHYYRCTGCQHTFKSILPKLDPYCPMPTCNKTISVEELTSQQDKDQINAN